MSCKCIVTHNRKNANVNLQLITIILQIGNNPVYDSIGAADILKYKLTRIEPISPVSAPLSSYFRLFLS